MSLSPNDIVTKTGALPTLPHVATKVMKLAADPATSAKDMQEAIITDQGMTARILKIANSAMFGMKREVKTLTHAIMLLGFDSIRSIVIAAATRGMFKGRASSGFKEKLIWERSIGSALIARGIAEQLSGMDKEEAFIGGLMHNVGKTVFNTKLADQYGQVMAKAYNENIPIHLVEREVIGFDHAELGYCIIKQWNLSEALANAIRWYLEPNRASDDDRALAAVVSLAVHFCMDLGLGSSKPIPLEEQDLTSEMQILGLTDERLAKWREVVRIKIENDSAMIQSF